MATYRDLNDYEVMYMVEEQDDNASELLLEKYKPIIIKLASKYKNEAKKCGLEIEDLVQEGYLGLYNAIQTYDSNNDVLFYTYAMISIRSKILNSLTTKSAIKHQCLNQSVSLFKPVSFDKEEMLMEILEDKNAVLPHLIVEYNEKEIIIHNFLLSLSFSYSLIFELKMNGFKNGEIVELLDLSLKHVSNAVFQIKRKFRIYLKKYS